MDKFNWLDAAIEFYIGGSKTIRKHKGGWIVKLLGIMETDYEPLYLSGMGKGVTQYIQDIDFAVIYPSKEDAFDAATKFI